MIETAGILIYRHDGPFLDVLLGHCGGPYWSNRDEWGIMKGKIEDQEEPLQAALREFQEETGVLLDPPYHFCGIFRLNEKKRLHLWCKEAELIVPLLRSNTTTVIYKGKTITIPEIDDYRYFEISTAKQKIFKSQLPILEALEQKLGQH